MLIYLNFVKIFQTYAAVLDLHLNDAKDHLNFFWLWLGFLEE